MSTARLEVPAHPVRVGLDTAAASVSAARSSAVSALSDDDLAAVVAECEQLAAQVAELGLALAREADDRDLGRRVGAASTAAWLRGRLRLRPGEARARLDLANRTRHAAAYDGDSAAGFDHRNDTSDSDDTADAADAVDHGSVDGDGDGERLDWVASVGAGPVPRGAMPATGAALRAGAVSAEHGRVIARILSKIPTRVTDEVVAEAEVSLAGWAGLYDPTTVANLGKHLLLVLDPDGTLPADEDETRRELRFNPDTGTIHGHLDREGMAQVLSALDPLAAPCPAADGTLDPRSPARRIADALVELARRACDRGDDLPAARGARPHLTLIADITTLLRHDGDDHDGDGHNGDGHDGDGHDGDGHNGNGHNGNGHNGNGHNGNGLADGRGSIRRRAAGAGELTWGGPVSSEAVRRIACDAGISRVITDPAGVPLDVGREARTVTPGQFVALVARDGGCVFPGCTRPPAWCEAHHITHWADGGDTALHNLALVCGFHHRTIHHRGWIIRLADDGHPEFIPPPWIDPTRTPRRTTRPRYHHPPDSRVTAHDHGQSRMSTGGAAWLPAA